MGSNKIYAGYKHGRICFVSSYPCRTEKFKVVEADCPEGVVDLKEISDNYKVWRGKLVLKDQPVPINELKIALVGVYKIPCGIATYSEALWREQKELVKEARIFSEYADVPEEPGVVRCWKRGQPLDKLIKEIDAYDPDIVFVQHEFGIFPDARYWLSFVSAMQKYRLVVTFHSVFRHEDKTICEAACPELIVHTNIAKNVLTKEKKVPGKVYVFPHGCFPPKTQPRLWNRYMTDHTVIQFGFGFRYKGWERAIEAIAKLKPKYPDIFFTGLFSESVAGAAAHDEYFHELQALIDKYELRNNVSLIRGFQSDETLHTFLRMNRVAIFPYTNHPEHVVFGSTGAARIAMTEGVPTIVSEVPLFHDLEGICPRPVTVDELCEDIEKFFDAKKAKAQVEKQNAFLTDNTWARMAARQLDTFSK